jgi:hypothetical protein
MIEKDISHESWREYVYEDGKVYRIENPVTLYLREGGTGHRVLDKTGVTHWVPVNTWHCIRWLTLPENGKPAEF